MKIIHTQLAAKGSFPEFTYINGDEWIVAQVELGGEKAVRLWRNREIVRDWP